MNDEATMMAEMAADADLAEPKPPEPGIEYAVPLAALTAQGEDDAETQPEAGDAVAVQLEGKFVRAENGQAIVRFTTANGEPMAPVAAPSEDEVLASDEAALRTRAAEEEGGSY